MASPPEITNRNLNGEWILNKSLSNDPDALLALQGIGWLVRKAISIATIVMTVKEYKKDDLYHVDMVSVAGGLSKSQEDRTLDWIERSQPNRIFGNVKGRSRFFRKGSFDMFDPGNDEDLTFLKGEKLKDGKTDSHYLEDDLIQSWATSLDGYGWTVEQVWGFEEINGLRYHTRRAVGRKGNKVQRVRLVYDYKGAVDNKATEDGLAYGEE